MVFPEIVSKEPLGPLVRQGDDKWADVGRWVLNTLINAEELGITQANVDELAKGTNNPEINRILGSEGSLAGMLGLEKDWAINAIKAGGNYGELFEKYLGVNTPLAIARGLNAQWKDGGLIYAPPMR
jgi:general L-amino acid transport system substrate-binding protein